MSQEVRVRRERVVIPTYEPAPPDRNPMFLEKRVYQGSSGRVYPLPFYNRIAETPTDREWAAIYLDNGLVEVMLLPEIGGRVHALRDLTNGYDAVYRQSVIKPALVGLAGPWISGGIEFNWPQHHRPSTFMPTDVAIEHGDDGSVTVWMGEHEPLDRTKGMHGICLRPGSNVVEIKVRLYNRTPYTQTFLWWANIATRVHEAYKSFFPPDAHMVADHAKRAVSDYPLCNGHYYGVDYAARGRDGVPAEEVPGDFVPAHSGGKGPRYAPNDLSWYANIPVPTSYMCVGTDEDFFGGYDFFRQAGLLHIADHLISPGKKQWTWGNHEFGYAWDRNLTDSDGPYIELMAGVFTDNQPDFSFIAPGETRVFSQFLYPYQGIGPVQFANLDAAISVADGKVGVAVTRATSGTVRIATDRGTRDHPVDLAPERPFIVNVEGVRAVSIESLGQVLATYAPKDAPGKPLQPATEPPLPGAIASADELYITGLHLSQYRHATRSPADYWREALRRDPGDMRCNNALGLFHLRRGEFEVARQHFQRAVDRATERNPNPYDGEALYNLGLALRFLGRDREAEDAFGKATWNAAWQNPANLALAELACERADWPRARDLLGRVIRREPDNLRARNLLVVVLRKLGLAATADETLDRLDPWAKWLNGDRQLPNNGVAIDLAIDYMRAGLFEEALEVLTATDASAGDGTVPMVGYYRAYVLTKLGRDATVAYRTAATADPTYCFPARLEDIAVLEAASQDDARAAYYLGNLMYDRRRYEEAIALWERAVGYEPQNAIAHRNLGIAAFNVLGDAGRARSEYDAAVGAAPNDSRLWYERDQLWKRIGVSAEERLRTLSARRDLVAERDDLTIEFCNLLNDVGEPEAAAEILAARRFQPWEGGEGQALGVFTRTHLALARQALDRDDAIAARPDLELALNPPPNLGEARHLLANASDLWLAYGDCLAALGDAAGAERWWRRAAEFRGDFQEMAVQPYSEFTYYQALAWRRLGEEERASNLLRELREYADALEKSEAKIDYFATSLPTMLLFNDDLQARQTARAHLLRQLAGEA